VYENDNLLPISSLSGQELASIDECVEDIAKSCLYVAKNKSDVYFHSETLLVPVEDNEDEDEDEDEEPAYGFLQCRHNNAPTAFPNEILSNINGKSFNVKPKTLGLSPWGNVEIKFETI